MEEIYQRPHCFLMAYTRTPEPGVYPSGLAGSVHFAVSRDGKSFEALQSQLRNPFCPGGCDKGEHPEYEKPEKSLCVSACGRGMGDRRYPSDGGGGDRPRQPGKAPGVENDRLYGVYFSRSSPLCGAGNLEHIRIRYDRGLGQYAAVWTDETGCWKSHSHGFAGLVLFGAGTGRVGRRDGCIPLLAAWSHPGRCCRDSRGAVRSSACVLGTFVPYGYHLPEEISAASPEQVKAVRAAAVVFRRFRRSQDGGLGHECGGFQPSRCV